MCATRPVTAYDFENRSAAMRLAIDDIIAHVVAMTHWIAGILVLGECRPSILADKIGPDIELYPW
jgi:hypothetical protein